MKRKTGLLVLLIVGSLLASNINAQDVQSSTNKYNQSKFHVLLDLHSFVGISQHSSIHGNDKQSGIDGSTIHLSAMYSILPNCSIGAGIGVDTYIHPYLNTFPIFVSAHYSPIKKHLRFYTYSDIGTSFKSGRMSGGLMFDMGVGYKMMLFKHLGANFQLGYNFKRYVGIVEPAVFAREEETVNRNSLSLGLGVIF